MKKSKLKRRLRKKLRVGEFQEFGFEVDVKFKPNLSEAVADKFHRDFIALLEANKLSFGGGSSPESLHGFIAAAQNFQSPSESHREKIEKWLASRSEIADSEVGKLVDAWYD